MLSVGVVIRTKNRAVLLKRALESVLNQTHQNWKLVVVNDGGEPASVDRLVALYQERWNGRVQVLHNSISVGMEAASNLGLSNLNTDLATIHDDDDSWSPEFLRRLVSTYAIQKQQFPNVGGVVCHINRVLETVEGNIVRIDRIEDFNQYQSTGFVPLSHMIQQNLFPPIGFLFELSTCKRIGMFDSTLPVLGDWDFHLRFLLEKDIWVLSETLAFYHHRLNATGALGNSVIAGVDKHKLYRGYLDNKWLRQDLMSGKLGIGVVMSLLSKDDVVKK